MAALYRRHRTWGLLLACVALVAPVACSGDDEPEPRAGDTSTPEPPARWPLTGEVANGGIPDRPALVVKVDNTASASPQVGLGDADLVVEELVEGGATRLGVFVQSRLPEVIGPVRSIRTTDIGLVTPTGGVLVASGAAGVVSRAVAQAGVTTAVEGAPGFSRDSARRAPYNLVVDPRALVKGLADAPGPPSQPYLPWATTSSAPTGGKLATSAEVTFSPAQTTLWAYAKGTGWTRENGLSADGDAFVADQLLVLRVTTSDAGYRDPAGNAVPETVTTGSGDATLLLGGRRVEAHWEKGGADKPFRLTTPRGKPLAVPPGHTWIELVPPGGSLATS